MIELVAAGAALASRALLQAADVALTAVGEDELREAHGSPRRVRWVLSMKRDPGQRHPGPRGHRARLDVPSHAPAAGRADRRRPRARPGLGAALACRGEP